MVKDNRIS